MKNTKLKTFLFFLLLAVVFWFFFKFSKEIESTINVKITYNNIPKEVLVTEKSTKVLPLIVKANGFNLLNYSFNAKTLTLDIANFYIPNKTTIEVTYNEYLPYLKEQYGANFVENIKYAPSVLVSLKNATHKKVPIKFVGEFTFKEGYQPVNKLKLIPDSVTISGDPTIINKIYEVSTKPYNKKNISGTIKDEIALDLKHKNINYSNIVVNLQADVKEFTQKEITVPIIFLNIPEDKKINYKTEEVTLTFQIGVEDYHKFNPSDFKIVCDFNEKITEGNFMFIKVLKQPSSIKNLQVYPKKISYLIFN